MGPKYFCCTVILLFALPIVARAQSIENAASVPEWIWLDEANAKQTSSLRFTKRIRIRRSLESAKLRFAEHSAFVKVSVDGRQIAAAEPYDQLFNQDVVELLKPGEHDLVAECKPVAGPSAFFLKLSVSYQDGSTDVIVSNASWSAKSGDVQTFGKVDSRLLIPDDRQVGTTATDNYDQWKQARGDKVPDAKFQISEGFEIERLRTAKPNEDSWVSMVFDPKGRVIIAKEKVGLLRMTIKGGAVQKVETIENTLKECRGLLFIDDTLFANANNSKGLYRLKSNGEDGYRKPELVYESSGGVGHGRNDLALGPDKKIYSIHGDSVHLPAKGLDYTSPYRDARNGKKTSEGHLLRIDPDSGNVELLAAGLRNPFGIDFNRDGEVFTYDADAEYDMGAPWYRPTRVIHLVKGADYGWRGVTKSWPPYYPDEPDFAPPGLDIGKGSPTAVKFGTRGNFPKRYREALFILDWTYGRIIAVHMLPRGASYLMTGETFLKGQPLNVTDLDFGPDGAMYFVTGGRKTQSSLYRVRYVGDKASENHLPSAQAERQATFAAKSRELRRLLEDAIAEPRSENTSAKTARALESHRPFVKYAARNLWEHDKATPVSTDPSTGQRVQALLRNARSLKNGQFKSNDQSGLFDLKETDLGPASTSEKIAAIRASRLVLDSDHAKHARASVLASLAEIYPDSSFPVNRRLSNILVDAEHPLAVPKTMELLRSARNPVHRMQYLFALRNAKQGWTPKLRREYFTAMASTGDFVGGEGMTTFLSKIREDATATLTESEQSDLAILLQSDRKTAIENQKLVPKPDRKLVRKWTLDDFRDLPASAIDLARGEQIYRQAMCVNCHRFSDMGTFVGPDLTSVRQRFSRKDILASILEPSAVVAEKYCSLQIVTTDGKSYVGQVALGGDYRSTRIRLATDPNRPFQFIEIDKEAIESKRYSKVSWMPKGLLDTFTRNEIEDLVGYLMKSSR